MVNRSNRPQHRWPGVASVLSLAVVGCVTVHGQKIGSDCLCITGGEIEVNCERNSYSMSAMRIQVEPGCAAQMGSVSVCTGIDDDGDGKLDKGDPRDPSDCGEVDTKVHDKSPGNHFVHGAISSTPIPAGSNTGYQEIQVLDKEGKIMYSDRRCIRVEG